MATEFHLFLPQMRMTLDAILERARAAEAAGFAGIAFMDHLAPPMAERHDMYDAMITAAVVGADTDALGIGHLVLCDSFREPAVLARQAVTLDHATGGRFELGIGWGSVPAELETYGIGNSAAPPRVRRLDETLDVLRSLWSGEEVDFAGEFHKIKGGLQQPTPLGEIPIVIGGAGPKTMALVAKHADVWNCPIYALDRFEDLRSSAGGAKPSLQEMVAYIPPGADRAAITELTQKRFAHMGDGLVLGDGAELLDHFGNVAAQGVERFYTWFTDFAPAETLSAFGTEVIAEMD
jgi:alkanesulfonate monooxygenase SsuD/methylene tetrahydromethanopterin reductase-like flavin-dependent oxidoreductase (luciferase family)